MEGRQGAGRGPAALDFGVYLRTGRLVAADSPLELKFNPYHDPRNGQFTFRPGGGAYGQTRWGGGGFSGGGRGSFGGGGASSREVWPAKKPTAVRRAAAPVVAPTPPPALKRPAVKLKRGAVATPKLRAGGAGARGKATKGPGAGAMASASIASAAMASASAVAAAAVPAAAGALATMAGAASAATLPAGWRAVTANGYEFRIDNINRLRRAEGELREDGAQRRSKWNQSRAGGNDRRVDDEGGHYIGRRFGGPRDAFNHFAQNGKFNQGAYKALEDKWASALRGGKRVWVRITPRYKGSSQRPFEIDVEYKIEGQSFSKTFPNG